MEYSRSGDYVRASIEGTPEEVFRLISLIQNDEKEELKCPNLPNIRIS